MSRRRPASFAELVEVIDQLPAVVMTARRMRRLNLREAAAESGVSFPTLSRLERGGECSVASLRLLLVWLDQPASTPDLAESP